LSIITPSFQSERRDQPRRLADRTDDYLHKTFSTPHCHACLERMADGVLLLDNETRVIYATPQVNQFSKRHNSPFALLPKFTLHHPRDAASFAAFINGKNQEAGSLSMLLEAENAGGYLLLLNCIQFPKPAEPDLQAARYMINLRDTNQFPSRNWLLFIKQFNLTPAEARFCQLLADGLTLNDYCEKWKVATSTARSQLHSVFGKTSTNRQSDLLRLIFLFSRI
jgi:DNA-binding CsgD family transcriptional regulator